ncbi:MAG: hypothetical protein J6Z82_10065 [Schwartzia sp.]|nr:hypothetical protein [Schwartzia sp. (in: firmicutes)]
MAAFEKVNSGINDMDSALDYIRMGDNVVWQVSSLDEFRVFAGAFAAQAVKDRRNLIYIRFAGHEPILQPMKGLKIVNMELSHLFETFTINIHNLIADEGKDAFYVFDCLSELEEAWATDLLMGDFFHLTCPFLFELDTVAFFPVIRGRHSFDAIAKIRDTTQLFLDVYPAGEKELFVRPVKVWNRYSQSMFNPHKYDMQTGEFSPVSESVEISRFYQRMNQAEADTADQNMDSWERFFRQTKLKYKSGGDVTEECSRICDIMLTRDNRMRELIKKNFGPQDYFEIHSRMVGTGMIGGKACGMLLARKIVENANPDIFSRIEPHDSFYIGSDVFYSFIVDNGFWDLKIRQKTEEEYFSLSGEFSEKIMNGKFAPTMEAEFRRILEYYGSDPVIVRSSSILEDGFGNAFAGKYESVFCGGTGSPEERLAAFEQAIRIVYASAVSTSALDYRKRRGLEKNDEQMALLVQRVSGSRYDHFFMPCAAGVGYSVSPYRLGAERAEEGMLRLVAGLGTAAVDRRTGSYPRIVSLDNPSKVMLTSFSDRHRFSQRLIDAVSSKTGKDESFDAEEIRTALPDYLAKTLFSHDRDAERMMEDRGQRRQIFFVSCEELVENEAVMEDMRGILRTLQSAYGNPVDVEYTINISPRMEYVIDILQCRPLQMAGGGQRVTVPAKKTFEKVLIETKGVSMGFSRSFPIDVLVYIDAVAYYEMPYNEKYEVKSALSAVNWKLRGQNKRMALVTPGRICTSSPELGVPSAFSDISEFDAIIEVSESSVGFMPELSYGSHVFQDLVEASILYSAVFEDDSTRAFEPDFIRSLKNSLPKYCKPAKKLKNIVYVYEAAPKELMLYYDMSSEHLLIGNPRPAEKKKRK